MAYISFHYQAVSKIINVCVLMYRDKRRNSHVIFSLCYVVFIVDLLLGE